MNGDESGYRMAKSWGLQEEGAMWYGKDQADKDEEHVEIIKKSYQSQLERF